MNRQVLGALFALGITGLFGCVGRPVDSFTLEVDLPAEFELKTAANYRPATGETCVLPQRRGMRPERKVFFTDYKPAPRRVSHELPLSETVDGCPLVLRSVEFDFYAKWGKRDTDVGGDIAGIYIRDRLDTPRDACIRCAGAAGSMSVVVSNGRSPSGDQEDFAVPFAGRSRAAAKNASGWPCTARSASGENPPDGAEGN